MSNTNFISRHQSREEAFALLYEKCYNDSSTEELIENAQLSRDFELSAFARELIDGVENNAESIDKAIEKNLKGWTLNRISKVVLSIMRIAVFEIMHLDNVPVSVSINEALELVKIYSTEKDVSFVNGVLGAVSRDCKK